MEVDVKKKKHSELGIASFIIAIFETIICIVVYLDNHSYYYLTALLTERLFFILVLSGPLVTLVLGTLGLIQKNRKRLFPILGIVLSILEYIAFIGVIIEAMRSFTIF